MNKPNLSTLTGLQTGRPFLFELTIRVGFATEDCAMTKAATHEPISGFGLKVAFRNYFEVSSGVHLALPKLASEVELTINLSVKLLKGKQDIMLGTQNSVIVIQFNHDISVCVSLSGLSL